MITNKYKGKELIKLNIENDSYGNIINPKAVYVEDYYSEELRRPEFVEINQSSALFENINKVNNIYNLLIIDKNDF